MKAAVVKVNARYQITIPKSVRNALNIKVGERLRMDVQENMIILIPKSANYTKYLQRLHPEIWENVDTEIYLSNERSAW